MNIPSDKPGQAPSFLRLILTTRYLILLYKLTNTISNRLNAGDNCQRCQDFPDENLIIPLKSGSQIMVDCVSDEANNGSQCSITLS